MNPDHPLPSEGGSYLRDPVTGILTLIKPETDYAETPAGETVRLAVPVEVIPAEPDPAPAKGRKTPQKEA